MRCVVCGKEAGGFKQVCPEVCRSKWRDMRMERNATISRLWQKEQKEAGRCVICAKPHSGGTWKCRECSDKANARLRERRAQRAKHGRCILCGAGMFTTSRFTRCLDCRVKSAAYEQRRRRNVK